MPLPIGADCLKAALDERTLSDDAAVAVFQEGDLIVVLRLRRENHYQVLIVDDGRGAVSVGPLHTLKALGQLLPQNAEGDQIGYEYARRVICRAFSDL